MHRFDSLVVQLVEQRILIPHVTRSSRVEAVRLM